MRANGDRRAEAEVDGSERSQRAVWCGRRRRGAWRAATVVGGLLLPLAAIVLASAASSRCMAGPARLSC